MSHELAKKFIMEYITFNKQSLKMEWIKEYKEYKTGEKIRSKTYIKNRYYTYDEIMWLYHRETINHSICNLPGTFYDGDDRTRLIDIPKPLFKLLRDQMKYLDAINMKWEPPTPDSFKYLKTKIVAVFSYDGKQEYLGSFKYFEEKKALELLANKRKEILRSELAKYTSSIFCPTSGPHYCPAYKLPSETEVKI
jgi:hypothetical protein